MTSSHLAYDYSVPPLYDDTEGITANFDHQQLKMYIPHIEPDLFGPAFIEDGSQKLQAHAYVWANSSDPNLYGDWRCGLYLRGHCCA